MVFITLKLNVQVKCLMKRNLPPSKVKVENVYSFSERPISVCAPIRRLYQLAGCNSNIFFAYEIKIKFNRIVKKLSKNTKYSPLRFFRQLVYY